MNWTNGEHAMALKEERERVRREMSIELADWQASSEAYRLDAEQLRAEVERLQGHMRALADTSVARDAAGIFKGLWQGSERECDELRADIERLRAALAEIIALKPEDMPHAIENSQAAAIARAALEPKP